MKIATWNVNGIRARQGELQDLLDREQPDVLCLQEIKASPDQLPVWLLDIEGYWGHWHGGKGYSGVALLVRKARWPDRPAFLHPPFDFEHRIVDRPSAGPDGGVDLRAQRRQGLRRQDAVPGGARCASRPRAPTSASALVLCGDLNVARTEHGRAPQGAQAAGHRASCRRSAR